ncbi:MULTISPECIES: transporter substrate-binding domain-containing protein [unclassified Pseudomonas]|uniref:substrate-binding periplasmic protein n=1 Tax=unclassified Pseudomonas TaxID=196821 RepID=UPI00244BBD18|nr:MULTISPECIES: transporter substrate-binding domain-containing protein [unclassified Pseudomonas]MDG9925105.1 transporter substrate-binding domain-containing protein [Pseudomonas sp. GD04045]MDH0037020.1 transporter substrate-binding domain-containing protein [Pseudomonas sp. GD04019]
MRVCWLALLLCLGWPIAQAGQALPAEIQLVSEHWVGHTNEDGSGLAWDVMRQVFEPAGVKVRFRIVPYTRSIGLVQRGEADAWLGSYRDEISEKIIYPRWPYDADQIAALSLREQPVPTLQSIGQYRLAWMRGYEYQRYLPGISRFEEIERRVGILRMLELGHADFYLDASTEVEDVLHEGSDPARFRTTVLTRLPLYAGFADTARGRALAELFDRRMTELVRDGALRAIFSRWQQPYPFDEDMEIPDASP